VWVCVGSLNGIQLNEVMEVSSERDEGYMWRAVGSMMSLLVIWL
jgi:hypothetical protein